MNLLNLFRYHGPIPSSIRFRATSLASQTKTYIAFDKDGTCYMYPVKPILLEHSGVWIPSGRKGMFQREEIRFTIWKYRYTDWKDLIIPSDADSEFTHRTYKLTRSIPKNTRL